MKNLLLIAIATFAIGCNGKKDPVAGNTPIEAEQQANASPSKQGYMLQGEHKLNKGDVLRAEAQTTLQDGNIKVTIHTGKEIDGKWSMETNKIIEQEVLESDESGATKLKYNIIRDIKKMSQNLAGKSNEKDDSNPLTGKNIIKEKKSNLWSFRLENGDPTTEESEALEKLEKRSNDDKFPYPSRKVSVGDTWDIPKNKINTFFGGDAPVQSGSGSQTLMEVLNYKNKKHALINVAVKVKSAPDEKGMTMEMSIEGQYYRDLENFINVDSDMKGQTKGSGELSTADGNKMSMIMEGPSTMTATKIINP